MCRVVVCSCLPVGWLCCPPHQPTWSSAAVAIKVCWLWRAWASFKSQSVSWDWKFWDFCVKTTNCQLLFGVLCVSFDFMDDAVLWPLKARKMVPLYSRQTKKFKNQTSKFQNLGLVLYKMGLFPWPLKVTGPSFVIGNLVNTGLWRYFYNFGIFKTAYNFIT